MTKEQPAQSHALKDAAPVLGGSTAVTVDDPGTALEGVVIPAALVEKRTVRERLVERTCEWCGGPVKYAGTGRPPKFCSRAHRTRAWEVRTAEQRQAADAEAGLLRTEPVREVVERVETVERTVRLPGRVEYIQLPPPKKPAPSMELPHDPRGWVVLLEHLAWDVIQRPDVYAADPATARLATVVAGIQRSLIPDQPTPDQAPVPQGPSRAERRRQEREAKRRRS